MVCRFKKGDRVIVRLGHEKWRVGIFDHYDDKQNMPFFVDMPNGQTSSKVYQWFKCLPYDENTWQLVGTIDNYKAAFNRGEYVFSKFFKCISPLPPFKVGETYWFDYSSNNGKPFYTVLSDNLKNTKIELTDEQLINNFFLTSE